MLINPIRDVIRDTDVVPAIATAEHVDPEITHDGTLRRSIRIENPSRDRFSEGEGFLLVTEP
jgi:hypothetical protein